VSAELEPIITLMWDKAEDGTYVARMIVSGLRSEQQAQQAMDHMQRLFCGQQQEPSQ
jgi:hypothetical protein